MSYVWEDRNFSIKNGSQIDPSKMQFVLAMMQENLQHARHVEMEKISYSTLHTALTIAAVVFIGDVPADDMDNHWGLLARLFYCLGLIFLCMISIKFNFRWSDVFDYHKECAAGCYYILHRDIIGKNPLKILEENNWSDWILKTKNFHESYYDTRLKIRKKPGVSAESCLDKLPLFMFTMNIEKNRAHPFSNSTRARNLFTVYNVILLIMVSILTVYIACLYSFSVVNSNSEFFRRLFGTYNEIWLLILIIAFLTAVSVIFYYLISTYSKKSRTYH